VITLDSSGSAIAPSTGQVEIVGRLASNVLLTDVVLRIVLTNGFCEKVVHHGRYSLKDRNTYVELFW
jgi:hypothetical protein